MIFGSIISIPIYGRNRILPTKLIGKMTSSTIALVAIVVKTAKKNLILKAKRTLSISKRIDSGNTAKGVHHATQQIRKMKICLNITKLNRCKLIVKSVMNALIFMQTLLNNLL